MAQTLLIAGTASHVGKSTVASGLCRLLARRGVSVAPYKAQNMSNNAQVVLTPDGDWGEIGVSQYVQARAAQITPTTDLNPVLLKPRGDGESQLVIQGEAVDHFSAGEYYEKYWQEARRAAVDSYERLAAEYDVVIAEGAGSIAEINLHDRDLANIETARFADAAVVLVVDIERGGAFASLYGTLELLPDDVRERVVGAVITKFRGDPSLLESGIEEIESRTGVPILGIVPYDDPGLPEEDSVSLPSTDRSLVVGHDDVPDSHTVTVAVPRLPRISNATDLAPLAAEPGVRVRYVSLDGSLEDVDAVILPGTKNTVDDLLELRERGFDRELDAFEGSIIGLCGGYQMLGREITNAAIEGTGTRDRIEGLGLLPVRTRFSSEKRVEQVTVSVDGVGPIADATGVARGYEIHMGETQVTESVCQPLGAQSAATDRVLGTYLHGLFENDNVRDAFVEHLFDQATVDRIAPAAPADRRPSPYDRAADLIGREIKLDAFGFTI